jgi:hypothetical protein
MNPESITRAMEMDTDAISHTRTNAEGAVVCAVIEDATGIITHYAARKTPRSMAHMALRLLRAAKNDLISRDRSTPLDQDDEAFLSNLADTIDDMEFYAEPEAAA